jgi:hypothetical protein
MRRPRKRTVLILVALLLLVGITVVVWEVADWPPPRLILKYGFPSGGGPTGRTFVDASGIEFVEIASGSAWYRHADEEFHRGLLDRIRDGLGLGVRSPFDTRLSEQICWVETHRPYWISRERISDSLKYSVQEEVPGISFAALSEFVYMDWFGDSFGPFLRHLADRQGGRYRLPSKAEVILAHTAGALGDTQNSEETATRDGKWESIVFLEGVETERCSFSALPDGLFRFRLVWVPPEKE